MGQNRFMVKAIAIICLTPYFWLIIRNGLKRLVENRCQKGLVFGHPDLQHRYRLSGLAISCRLPSSSFSIRYMATARFPVYASVSRLATASSASAVAPYSRTMTAGKLFLKRVILYNLVNYTL